MLVTATRLQVKDLASLKTAMRLSNQVVEQLRRSPGFAGARLLVDRRGAMWTLSVWHDKEALAIFREVHAEVAAHGPAIASDMAMTGWQQESASVPTWREVRRRWSGVTPPAVGLRKTVKSRTTAVAGV